MPRLLRSFTALLVVVGALAACSDDPSNGSTAGSTAPSPTTAPTGSSTSTTTTTSPTSTTEAESAGYEGYADHESRLYRGTQHWICHPDLDDDVCADLDTTVLAPGGGQRVVKATKDPGAPVDCLYLYPTTSGDPEPVADLDVDATELDTVRAQVARFGSVCRVFAPAYRQITLVGLGGSATEADREIPYADVLDAWKTYVNDENEGRGVVLIGHSQGAGLLQRLVAEEIDGDPELRELLVSAFLLGSRVAVPEGEVVGGAFRHVPACESDHQTRCVVAYASYPDTADPAASGAIFGSPPEEGQLALCVDPVGLLGEDTGDAVIPTHESLVGAGIDAPEYGTPFLGLPQAVHTSCVLDDGYSFLRVGLADPADQRPVQGLVEERLGPTWGLHQVDANHVQDDLIELVRRQAAAHGER